METVSLRPDELESLRLADLVGLYQEECAERMGISRTTLSRTLAEARRKVSDALINGKRLLVEASPPGVDGPSRRCSEHAEGGVDGPGMGRARQRRQRTCIDTEPFAVADLRPQHATDSNEEDRDEEDRIDGE